jgi:putative transposase
VTFRFIQAEKTAFPVAVLCDVLDVSRSGFYAWMRRPRSERAKQDALLAAEITAVHGASRKTYGSPRIHTQLRRQGRGVSRKRVARLMREHGMAGRRRRRFRKTTDSRHDLPVAPNVLQRDFTSPAANEAWVGDITYVPTDEGWLYLAVLLDLYSRRVVGWATSSSLDRGVALDALDAALRARKPEPGLVHHTDRGCQYASDDYRKRLADALVERSMSRTGDCWDNAVAESFFATIKGECLDQVRFATRQAATAMIADYIDVFYNHQRLHSSLGYMSPVEYELKKAVAAMAA